jgi:hypothetical protein
MSEIQPGARVRVSYPATYVEWAAALRRHVISMDGGQWVLLPGAEIEVLSPALPVEPPVGGYAELRTTSLPPEVWAHRDEGWLPAWPVDDPEPATWADLHAWGTVTVLVPANSQPRYEPVNPDRRVVWLHDCGHRREIPVIRCIPEVDPNDPPAYLQVLGGECYPRCPAPGARWIRLYREVPSDG